MGHPYDSIPALAGIATNESASHVGYGIDHNVQRLQRYLWTERRVMASLIAHLPAMPIWEVKCAMALHQWQCAEHVEWLRHRITEMRSPAPNLDAPPEQGSLEGVDQVLDAIASVDDPLKVVNAIYGVVLPAVAGAYRTHIEKTNPLVDHPTRRLLRFALQEVEDALAWGKTTLHALSGHASAVAAESHRFHPRRDERFHGQYNFEFPPHVVYSMPDVPANERNLALLCKRALEMDVPEMMASFITERTDQPWEFYRDYSRQLWDEARHSMMGTVGLTAHGVNWKQDVPLNVSFALRLNLHATPLERQTMLYAIEQSLMPGETGKRFEYDTAVAAADALSAHFHDYDWADEVLHSQIGRRALKRDGISPQEAAERAKAIHEKTWAALDQYRGRDPQENWWPEFVRKTLGKESAVAAKQDLGPINIFSE
ncbi:MAG: hypothetical protein ACRENU_05350 [Gemmatimonadaceae bacterium]